LPSTLNQPGQAYPQVNSQRAARFRIEAPEASSVRVSLGLGGSGGRGGNPQGDAEALKAAGINSVFYISPDTAHEFLSWRRSLREFAPLLFRD
jgi:S-formylglutathione hydrolase FrmB